MKDVQFKLLAIIFVASLAVSGYSQPQTVTFPIRIDTVIVVGNEHTKTQIIMREIPFTFPDSLKESDFVLIRNRLQNLYLFNRVELQVAPLNNKMALIIMVTESWYIFPLPILFINERDWSKISYGLQFSHYNFRGRNEKLNVGGWLGYDPAFFLNYYNPWIGKKSRIILGLGFTHRMVANKFFDFRERRTGSSLTLGRKLTLNLETQLDFSIQRIQLPQEYKIYSVSGSGTDWAPSISYQVKWDRRDLFEYPRSGFYVRYKAQRTGFSKNQPRFWRFESDQRVYIPLYKKVTLALRNLSIFDEGKLPIYDRVFLGYSERIRGYFDRVFPDRALFARYNSTNLSLNSAELRFPIIPVKYFSWDDAPLLSSLYQDLKFGVSGAIFIDSGIAWQDKNQFAIPNYYTGYGFGLHIHLPYVYLLRLEYAWNDAGEGQFIIDAGVSF